MGMDQMALGMYRHAVDIDLGPNPFSSNEGIHSAAMGGIWQCGVCGFAGLKWEEEMLSMENHLPDTWKSMEFRICWRGAEIKVRIEKRSVVGRASWRTRD